MDKDTLTQKIRDWYNQALDVEDKNRINAEDDLEFLDGDQWPATTRQEREQDGRPCLQINRLPQIVDRVVGAQRQNRPGIKIRPVDDIADPDTANVLTGLIRNIENTSNADIAYDNAFEHALTAGFGFFRIVTVYSDDESFAQDIKIKPIFNNFTVHFDPSTKNKITMEDAGWCIVTHQMDRDSFEKEYPDAALTSADSDDFDGVWVTRDTVTVAEVFVVKKESSVLYLLKNGETTKNLSKGQVPVQQRNVEHRTVVRYMTNGIDIIDGPTEWPGKYIPIIPVWGKETNIKGDRRLRGTIRYAKDPQRMYNYWRSAATETVALAPRTPFIGTAKQFAGYEAVWSSSSRKNYAYLPYNPDPQAPGAPQRSIPATVPSGLTEEAMQTADEIKATTGIYDASLGARSNETSGKAIRARQEQGDLGQFAYVDNLSRALQLLGSQLIDLIPKIYDAERVVRIIGKDGGEEWIKLYQPYIDTKTGKTKVHDPGVGKYDVTVDVGPAFATRRAEAAETMMEIVRASPRVAETTIDIVADSLDWPNKDKFVERLQKTLPPELRDKDEDKKPTPEEQMQVQVQQMQQQLEQQAAQLELQGKALENQQAALDLKKTAEEIKGEYIDNVSKARETGVNLDTPLPAGDGPGNNTP